MDGVQATCGQCKGRFRIRARKLVSGYSCQCPGCEAVIFFEEDSPKAEIKAALLSAKAVRRALREEEKGKVVRAAPYVFARR